MGLSKKVYATLLERAREAQRERRWRAAERLWHELLAARPGDRAAQAGLGTLLLARGRIVEARPIAAALRRDFPNDVAGPTLAARIAAEDENWPEAAQRWRDVLAIKDDVAAALNGLGVALLTMGDVAAAEKWAEQLARRFPDQIYGAALSARVAVARDDTVGAVAAWQSAVERRPDDKAARRELCRALSEASRLDEAEHEGHALLASDREEGLMQLGNMVARREPDGDQTDFWKSAHDEFPANVTFLRRAATSALKAGRDDDAIAAMDVLIGAPDASLADAGAVVGFAHLLAARGEQGRARIAVRRYLQGLSGSAAYHLAALRLSRIVFAQFAKTDTARRISYRERTRRMIARAPLKPRARSVLEGSVTLEEILAAQAPSLFDTDVSRAECLTFIAHVRERLARREPFSFVRMNDAESNALSYPPELVAHYDSDAAERETVWWGRALTASERAAMAARVAHAAWQADAIGIPTFARILRDVHLNENDDLNRGRSGRGLLTALSVFPRWREFRPHDLPAPLFTSANLHQDLQRWNLYRALFDGAGEIVTISCHVALPDAMQREFGVAVAANIVVPPRHASLHAMGARQMETTLPDVLDEIGLKVREQAKGRLVIVGAGYAGKWLVDQAKQAGGIALDVGSVLDYWMGLKTRSYQDLA